MRLNRYNHLHGPFFQNQPKIDSKRKSFEKSFELIGQLQFSNSVFELLELRNSTLQTLLKILIDSSIRLFNATIKVFYGYTSLKRSLKNQDQFFEKHVFSELKIHWAK